MEKYNVVDKDKTPDYNEAIKDQADLEKTAGSGFDPDKLRKEAEQNTPSDALPANK